LRLDPVRVRDALRRAERVARRERDLGSGQEQGDLSVDDVEHLVLLVVDVQRWHIPLRHEDLEHGVAPVGLLTRDVDLGESVDEPEWRRTLSSLSRHLTSLESETESSRCKLNSETESCQARASLRSRTACSRSSGATAPARTTWRG